MDDHNRTPPLPPCRVADEIHESVTEDSSEEESDSCESSTGFDYPISKSNADKIYDAVGKTENERTNNAIVVPSPHILRTSDEKVIHEAKTDLNINFDLDYFQIQALLAIMNGHNAIVISPCGSGKLLIFYMGLYILGKRMGVKKGVGICLQPLNSILKEKTNSNPLLKTAFLTISGEGVTEENTALSHDLHELKSGNISCLLGHAESFLSPRGKTFSEENSYNS